MKGPSYHQRPNTSSNVQAFSQDHSGGHYFDPREHLRGLARTGSNNSVPENHNTGGNSSNPSQQMSHFYPPLDTDENEQFDQKRFSSKQLIAQNQIE